MDRVPQQDGLRVHMSLMARERKRLNKHLVRAKRSQRLLTARPKWVFNYPICVSEWGGCGWQLTELLFLCVQHHRGVWTALLPSWKCLELPYQFFKEPGSDQFGKILSGCEDLLEDHLTICRNSFCCRVCLYDFHEVLFRSVYLARNFTLFWVDGRV